VQLFVRKQYEDIKKKRQTLCQSAQGDFYLAKEGCFGLENRVLVQGHTLVWYSTGLCGQKTQRRLHLSEIEMQMSANTTTLCWKIFSILGLTALSLFIPPWWPNGGPMPIMDDKIVWTAGKAVVAFLLAFYYVWGRSGYFKVKVKHEWFSRVIYTDGDMNLFRKFNGRVIEAKQLMLLGSVMNKKSVVDKAEIIDGDIA